VGYHAPGYEPWTAPFAAWESFYVLIGTAAAALIGLQFVVITVGAQFKTVIAGQSIKVFATPTIVHLGVVLVAAAIAAAPWRRAEGAAYALSALGIAGLAYTLFVLRNARLQSDYKPVLVDWIWHTILPLAAYGMLLASASLLPGHEGPCLFLVGAASLLLLVIGIHNAWDEVTYIATKRQADESGK
jgi:hypothetical protein